MEEHTPDNDIVDLVENGWTLTIRAVEATRASGVTLTANGTEWKNDLYVHYRCMVEAEKQGVRLIGRCQNGTTPAAAAMSAIGDAHEQVVLLAKRAIGRARP